MSRGVNFINIFQHEQNIYLINRRVFRRLWKYSGVFPSIYSRKWITVYYRVSTHHWPPCRGTSSPEQTHTSVHCCASAEPHRSPLWACSVYLDALPVHIAWRLTLSWMSHILQEIYRRLVPQAYLHPFLENNSMPI